MQPVRTDGHMLQLGEHFSVNFQKTLRIPDDGRTYPLPPGLGAFPVSRVADYTRRIPREWHRENGFFIPMYQREALWMSFMGSHWSPNAVIAAVGNVNVVTGKPNHWRLDSAEQNYLVCPDQPWLDGINAGNGFIRQFVAMPLGMGYTVEGQITGSETFGGIQIRVYEPKPGRFLEPVVTRCCMSCECAAPAMGLGAGGRMTQKIYPDRHGIDIWDPDNYADAWVYIVNSMDYREITGKEPPHTPVSARTYTEHGFPWFDLYDENKGDLAPSDALSKVKSIKEKDAEKISTSMQDDEPIEVAKIKKFFWNA